MTIMLRICFCGSKSPQRWPFLSLQQSFLLKILTELCNEWRFWNAIRSRRQYQWLVVLEATSKLAKLAVSHWKRLWTEDTEIRLTNWRFELGTFYSDKRHMHMCTTWWPVRCSNHWATWTLVEQRLHVCTTCNLLMTSEMLAGQVLRDHRRMFWGVICHGADYQFNPVGTITV